MTKHRIYTTRFASVYPHHVAKAERKGRMKSEVEEPLMREILRLDKLIDQLARGRRMEKILREG